MSPLVDILNSFGHPRVLVLGDLILDRYTWGDAERVSPEAPVLVLRVENRELRLGGAASVAMMLRGLEADAVLAGVIGDDPEGRAVLSLLRDEQINVDLVLIDPERPTTTKERFIGRTGYRNAGGSQVLRVDQESREPISGDVEEKLLSGILGRLGEFQAVLVSDYAKGVCTPTLLRGVIDAANDRKVPVIVDPARIADFSRYRNSTVLKPNRFEAESATGLKMDSPDAALEAGGRICDDHTVGAVVITLDRDGMVVVANDGAASVVPSEPREVYDITGAGDMVLGALGLGLASGVPLMVAARLANCAAGLEVERFGVAPVIRQDLRAALCDNNAITDPKSQRQIGSLSKIISLSEAGALADVYRAQGQTVVFTNGCFDLLHVGHLTMLEGAAALGDVLIVAVNSDASVRALKGPSRPAINEHDRAAMVASLACVDHVLIFSDSTPHSLLEQIRPDILVKGGTTGEIVGREVVEAYGGRVYRAGNVPGLSTTAILSRLGSDLQPEERPRENCQSAAGWAESRVVPDALSQPKTIGQQNARNH